MFFFAPNNKAVNLSTIPNIVLSSQQTNGQNGGNTTTNPNGVLQTILLQVAPFNTKLIALVGIINSGNATPSELAFYHNLLTVFFDSQVSAIAKQTAGSQAAAFNATALALLRDLKPFSIPAATPF